MSEKDSTKAAVVHDEGPRFSNVLNADLQHALSTGPQLDPRSAAAFKLYLILSVVFMSSLSFGFDTSVVSSVNGIAQYTDYFHIGGGATGGGQGITTAMLYTIFSIGCVVGSFGAAPAADIWGRRVGMISASITILIVRDLSSSFCIDRTYLFFGRFFIGAGSALNAASGPSYVAEITPPKWRGRLGGLYNTFNNVGGIICAALVIGTGSINSSASWRLPFAIQLIPTIILFVGAFFIPESPRWLMSVGRKEEARAILAKYHGNGDTNAPLVVLEYKELETHIQSATKSRCYYLTVALDLTGVKTQNERLIFSFVAITAGGVGALIGAAIVDRVGRRALWFWGTAASSLALALTAAFTATSKTGPAVAFLVILSFTMNMTYQTLASIYPSECLSFEIRAKGIAAFACIESLAAIVNNFSGAIAFQKIGWKFFLVFAVWDAFEAMVIWFCAVETKGRTLEELNEIFQDPNPVQASLKRGSY
ncbi:major facilitator superfamily domain-containing protein [Roridomyces roridus]|uniref:Major facilitator superfamily domain-containing protein n=1 Tax=Roridomyces roridus TaxID=1738132 RepID=A0AAD7FRW6_9AGAR|nr:major facilitator superfamily domain-containing protein [Roridomyces roridus]